MKTTHTPTPYGYGDCSVYHAGRERGGEMVATATNEANAAFIVKACNSHYELLEAAKKALEFMENIQFNDSLTEHEQSVYDAAKAAITKAEGGAA